MGKTRKFGIVTSTEGLQAGICVNGFDFQESAEIAEARNEKGQITDLASYSVGTTLSINGVMDTQKGTVCKAGSMITISGKNYIVESVQKTQSNTNFVQLSISARTADNAEIHIVTDDSNSSNSNE